MTRFFGPLLNLSLILTLGLTLAAQLPAQSQERDRQAPADSLDGWWSEAEALLARADSSKPAYAEAQALLDKAALTESRKDAKALAQQACELLRGIAKSDAPPPGKESDPGDGEDGKRRRAAPTEPGDDAPLRQRFGRRPDGAPGGARPGDRFGGDGQPPLGEGAGGDVQRLMRQLREVAPDLAEEFRNADPKSQGELRERLRHLFELRRSSPDLFELEIQDLKLDRAIGKLAGEIRSAPAQPGMDPPVGDETAAAPQEAELKRLVTELFELRLHKLEKELEVQRAQMAELEKRVAAGSELLSERTLSRESLIKSRVDRLMGREDKKDW